MKCPKCQTEAAPGSLFCPKCGGELPAEAAFNVSQPSRGDAFNVSALSAGAGFNVSMPSKDAPPLLPSRPQSRRWQTGEKVLGRYRIVGELGRGGMGVVYKCLDEVGGIEVALKALPPELSRNSAGMEEVRENFQLVAKLAHPNIAAVRTLERDSNGDYFLIMECVEGMDVWRWLKQTGKRASLEDTLGILWYVAQALDYAHSQKVIHRDIKPANVIIRADGAVKVLDFGLAAQIHSSLSRVSQAKQGTSGTGPYMAPEQWRGQYQDAATDQYALAVVAYELLAGRLPFDSPDAGVLREAVLKEEPARVERLDHKGWRALRRGLAKSREERYERSAYRDRNEREWPFETTVQPLLEPCKSFLTYLQDGFPAPDDEPNRKWVKCLLEKLAELASMPQPRVPVGPTGPAGTK